VPTPSPSAARRARVAGAAGVIAAAVLVVASPARAATTTLFAAPTGTGTTCSAAQPCSLPAAQAAVRTLISGMSGDIVVQLADGVYRLSAPLRLTAADSGTNGHTVIWQAAPSAHPTITGARQVTGWSLADSGKNIWRAAVGTGIDTRQLYVNGTAATNPKGTVQNISAPNSYASFQPVLLPTGATLWRGTMVTPMTLRPRALMRATMSFRPLIT